MPEPMTIEQCREYSAVEILGWKLIVIGPTADDTELVYSGGYHDDIDGGFVYPFPKAWKPDLDRNQLYEIVKGLGYEDEDDVPKWARSLFMNRYKATGPSAVERVRYSFETLCLQFPAEALQAICEAHRGHQE